MINDSLLLRLLGVTLFAAVLTVSLFFIYEEILLAVTLRFCLFTLSLSLRLQCIVFKTLNIHTLILLRRCRRGATTSESPRKLGFFSSSQIRCLDLTLDIIAMASLTAAQSAASSTAALQAWL